ncbi:MAG: 1,4-dihydroxy-2-naphthoate polyprenyltransferase [Actinomycetota bacterium]|jgi:1,4-dihydroxy-2-naphthoate octaprenyltransferase|nr:1,4-dihydroxy-2-naphthoate polyprenyltransferase [Actinomycetota bacterium]
MAKSTVHDVFEDIAPYSHAVLAYVDPDGYPVSVAAEFHSRPERGTIELTTPSVPSAPVEGAEVNVIFSHIRPYPGVGYDQRRYVSVWGTIARANGTLEVKPRRTHGWDEDRMSFFELCERSVPSAHEYMRKLSTEQGREVKAQMSLGWLIFMATRLPFLTATIVPILLGALVARADGYSNWGLFLLAFIGGCAIHLGLNVANDVSDATSGADGANVNPTMFSGGSRMIQYGLVSLKQMRNVAIGCYAVGIGIGLYLVATRGLELLWIGIAGVFLSIFYTAPPFKLVHRGLGEVAVAAGFGPIMVLGTYFVIAQRFTFEAFYASLPVGILIMLVLYVNQIPDRPADEKVGKRTVVVRFGKDGIVKGYAFFVALAFVLIAAGALTGVMPVWTLVALPTAYLGLKVYRSLDSNYESPYELMAGMGQNIMLHLFCGLALCAGYLLDIIFG